MPKTVREIQDILRVTCVRVVESEANKTLEPKWMGRLITQLGYMLGSNASTEESIYGGSTRWRSAPGKFETTGSDIVPTIEVLKEEVRESGGLNRCKQAIENLLTEFKQKGTTDQSFFADIQQDIIKGTC